MNPLALSNCDAKRRYPDRREAKKVRRYQQRSTGTKLYVYRCPICRGYHLTKSRG